MTAAAITTGHPATERACRLLSTRPWHTTLVAFAIGLAGSASAARGVGASALALALLAATRRSRWGAPGDARRIACAQALVAAAIAVVVGLSMGSARLAAIDAATMHIVDGAPLAARAQLLDHPRPSPFGSSAELRVVAGPLRGVRLLGRLPRWAGVPGDVPIGAELRVRGRLHSLGAIAVADRGRDFKLAAWLRRRRLAGELLVAAASPTGAGRSGLAGLLDQVRSRAERGVDAGLPDDRAALLRGMVLGQDEAIPEAQRDEFRAAGLAHILAVSGQNVMLLAALAIPLLMAAGLGVYGRGLALLGLIALYVPLAGAGPSLQRAGIMGAAGIAALLAARPASRSYALLLAVVLTLTFNPRASGDPGWQLSFAAVTGILILGRRLSGAIRDCARAFRLSGATSSSRLNSLGAALAEGVAVTVAATLATAPLLAHHFGVVSLAALPANVLALPLVAPAMWLGMLKAVAGQLTALGLPGDALAAALGALATIPLGLIALLAERFAELPAAQLHLRLTSPAALAGSYAVLVLALLAIRAAAGQLVARAGEGGSRWRRLAPGRRAALASVAAALAAFAFLATLAPPRPPGSLTVRFLDVGQGDATLIQHPDGTALLFDGGPPEAGITRLLRRAGVRRLALVVATHMSRDHHGGLRSVLTSFPVGLLLDGGDGTRDRTFRQLEAEADRRGVRRLPAIAPLDIRAGGLRVRVLSPPPRPAGPPPEDPNPRAVTAIVSADRFDLMLSGDAESPTLSRLPLPAVAAIKVSHHGSSDPGLPAVLKRLRPALAGIEVGRDNSYGHPAPSTLAALRHAGVRTYRTDRDGTISVTIADGAMRVETER